MPTPDLSLLDGAYPYGLSAEPSRSRPFAAESFAIRLVDAGVTLPVRADPTQIGVIFDAAGHDVLTIDSNGNRDDDDALYIAGLVALAVNTMAGHPTGTLVSGALPSAAPRRPSIVDALMRDDPDLTRDQALALIAETDAENANPLRRTSP